MIFLLCATDLSARKRKHGVRLMILTKDSKVITGELLCVKENSLLLIDPKSKAGISVAVDKISKIRMLKKSKYLKYTGYFLLSSLALGAAASTIEDSGESLFPSLWAMVTIGGTAA